MPLPLFGYPTCPGDARRGGQGLLRPLLVVLLANPTGPACKCCLGSCLQTLPGVLIANPAQGRACTPSSQPSPQPPCRRQSPRSQTSPGSPGPSPRPVLPLLFLRLCHRWVWDHLPISVTCSLKLIICQCELGQGCVGLAGDQNLPPFQPRLAHLPLLREQPRGRARSLGDALQEEKDPTSSRCPLPMPGLGLWAAPTLCWSRKVPGFNVFSWRLGKRRGKWLDERKEKAEQKEIGHKRLGTAWAGRSYGDGPG